MAAKTVWKLSALGILIVSAGMLLSKYTWNFYLQRPKPLIADAQGDVIAGAILVEQTSTEPRIVSGDDGFETSKKKCSSAQCLGSRTPIMSMHEQEGYYCLSDCLLSLSAYIPRSVDPEIEDRLREIVIFNGPMKFCGYETTESCISRSAAVALKNRDGGRSIILGVEVNLNPRDGDRRAYVETRLRDSNRGLEALDTQLFFYEVAGLEFMGAGHFSAVVLVLSVTVGILLRSVELLCRGFITAVKRSV